MKPVVERGSRLRFGLLALGASATAAAGNFDYQVTAGAAHSDNIARVETGTEKQKYWDSSVIWPASSMTFPRRAR